eukprot:GGOE01002201.1.p1 GENE.GGOE01002201.1~~GGOE01002201.1.p1  ORF type:complete len:339 (+),score=20.64 GGOE01002201.1:52-1068(+)
MCACKQFVIFLLLLHFPPCFVTAPNSTSTIANSTSVPGLSASQIANNEAKFSRVEGSRSPRRWLATACPLEMTSTSCYWHNFSRAWELENRPLPGVSHPFSVSKFEELIRCRTLVFVGDSVALQFWQAVGCLMPLKGANLSVHWNKKFNDKICPFGARHCFIKGGCVHFPKISSRVCYSRHEQLPAFSKVVSAFSLDADSIVIANTGLHAHAIGVMRKEVFAFLRHASSSRVPNTTHPAVLWFETIAQHFPGHPSGYYQPPHHGRVPKYLHCSPIVQDAAYGLDWRNRALDELLEKLNVPVIRLWNRPRVCGTPTSCSAVARIRPLQPPIAAISACPA